MRTTLLILTLAAGCLTATAQTAPSRAPVVPGNPDRIDPVRFGQFVSGGAHASGVLVPASRRNPSNPGASHSSSTEMQVLSWAARRDTSPGTRGACASHLLT
jgi:hypothetical protein